MSYLPADGNTSQSPAGDQSPQSTGAPAPGYGPRSAASLGRRNGGLPRWALLSGAIATVAICTIVMVLFLGFNIGPTGLVIGLIAAMLPVPVLVACFLWLDRYEPEPLHYLLFAFGWGAVVATLVALLVNGSFSGQYGSPVELPEGVVATVVAPIIEELMKALGPLLILWLRRREISGITDGIVYCGLSGVGFAMVENVLYLGGHGYASGVAEYGPATGAQLVFALFIMRILFSGFAHPLFTAMTGIGIGIAARSNRTWVRVTAPLLGLAAAMVLHASWNLMATLAAKVSMFFFLYGYVSLMVPLFLTMIGLALWIRSKEGRLTAQVMADYARAGWITPPEVAALSTLTRRHAARAWAQRVAGDPGRRAMKDLQFTAVRLALLRDSLNRGLYLRPRELEQAAADERLLLDRIMENRSMFVGRDPQMPRALWNGNSYLVDFPDGQARALPAPAESVVPLPFVLAGPPPTGYAGPTAPATPNTPGWGAPGPTGPAPSGFGWSQPGSGGPGWGQPGQYPQAGYPQSSVGQPSYPQAGSSPTGYPQAGGYPPSPWARPDGTPPPPPLPPPPPPA